MTDSPLIDDRRQHALSCADVAFKERGFHGSRLSDVAALANLTEADLQGYFPTVSALHEAVVDLRFERWLNRIRASCAEVASPVDRLLAVFVFLETWFGEDAFPKTAFSHMYAALGNDEGWVIGMGQRHIAEFTAFIEDLAVAAGIPRPIGTSIAILAEGAQLTAALTLSPAPAREARTAAAMLIAVYQADLDDLSF